MSAHNNPVPRECGHSRFSRGVLGVLMGGSRAVVLSFLCLLLSGVPASRAAGQGSLTPQNATVEVDVACDGTGTRLQDTLNGLNPFASAYEVRVSGYCPEPLYIEKFLYLRLVSADAVARASVGKIYVATSAHNVYVDRLRVVDTGIRHIDAASYSIRAASNRFEMNDSEVFCEFIAAPARPCKGVLKDMGLGLFYNVDFTGQGWASRALTALRSTVFVFAYNRESFDAALCLELDSVEARDRGSMQVYQGVGCPTLSVSVGDHSDGYVALNDSSSIAKAQVADLAKLSVYDRAGSSRPNGKLRTYRQMVGSTSCGLFSVVHAVGEAKKNYCGP